MRKKAWIKIIQMHENEEPRAQIWDYYNAWWSGISFKRAVSMLQDDKAELFCGGSDWGQDLRSVLDGR